MKPFKSDAPAYRAAGKESREGDENSPPSHGICESCKYKELKRVGLR